MAAPILGMTNRRTHRKILVVEDNELNRLILVNQLKDNFEILEAENGQDGFDLLKEHYSELSLVLLDIYMPICDGFEFLRMKGESQRYKTIPVIVTTAGSGGDDEIRCLELGANDFVKKPYDFEIIKNRINNVISLRESAAILNQLTWDDTTQLYSKQFFYHTAEDILIAHPHDAYDVICSDIENFKSLNDRYGEAACDRLLKNLADELMDTIPDIISAGRIGADVFAFLIKHQTAGFEEALPHVAKDLVLPNVSVKFGIVENVDHQMTIPQICTRAIRALQSIKGRYGVDIAQFDDELHRRQIMEQTIRDTMEEALGKLQFSVFYQPKHDVRINRIGGAEALVRWSHPDIGFVSPGVFIPIFERNGFITRLDLYVWEEACREIERCRKNGLPVVPISINASRLDFDLPDLPARIAELADRHGVEHELLHVELTETAYTDNPESVTQMLAELKERGFSIELDDFGSGYSSLVSLNTLPLDVMKLDMSMIRQATALNDYRIVESTIRLAQTLGLKTVVEGVETEDEATRLTAMGCDYIQGYYFSKPLCQEEFEEYLQRWT